MFCTRCGNQYADNSSACPACGAPNAGSQPVQPAQPAQPGYTGAQPGYQAYPNYNTQPTIAPATARQKKLALVIAFLSIFALIMGVMHTFSMVDIPVNLDVDVEEEVPYYDIEVDVSESIEIPDLPVGLVAEVFDIASEFEEDIDDAAGRSSSVSIASFGMGYAGLIIFGVANLVIAAIGILFYLRARNNSPLYDQFCSFIKGDTPLVFLSFVGVVAFVLEFVCMLFVSAEISASGNSIGVSVGLSDESWLCLLVYGVILAYHLLVIKDEKEA